MATYTCHDMSGSPRVMTPVSPPEQALLELDGTQSEGLPAQIEAEERVVAARRDSGTTKLKEL